MVVKYIPVHKSIVPMVVKVIFSHIVNENSCERTIMQKQGITPVRQAIAVNIIV
jgi:hypothetical protein